MAKKEKIKMQNSENEDIVKRFLILLVVIVVIVLGIYFVSKSLVNRRNSEAKTNDITAGVINYDIATVGTLLNRPYNEYYVMVYNSEDTEAVFYSSLITNYQKKQEALKIYFCDLSNLLNSSYVAAEGESNPKASTIDELKFGKITLIKVKKGKINNYIETVEAIKDALQ
ncbi:MAG: hypothetical protein E7164_04765 [Firmicutes bacterium]|nr:hypothetical protein [Bacillota bacterium]